jgi:CRISPR-associated protein Csd1
MILQALAEYYARVASTDDASVAPPGFERKEIPFVVVIDREGRFSDLEDTRTGEGKRKRGRMYAVPQAVKRTVAIAPNLLWDNPTYVFGVDAKGKPERAVRQHAEFVAGVRKVARAAADEGTRAVLDFLERGEFHEVFAHPSWKELEETGANVSFRLDADAELVCQREAVRKALTADSSDGGASEPCMVTGEPGPVARLHAAIKGVWGAQTSGANIVSFNLDAFGSHGRKQGFNAPVGMGTAFAYTTALNHLLRRDSPQRMQVGDASTVFWAERAVPLETAITRLFDEPPKDDPHRNTEALRVLYDAPLRGTAPEAGGADTRFYVLGLAPNASRIAVRFWLVSTVAELSIRIRQHFDDLRIIHAPFEPEMLSLFRLLVSTAAIGKPENIRPNLAAEFLRAALDGTAYPRELLGAAVQRIRAEREVTYPRAALLKACLVREGRANPHNTEPEVDVALDDNNPNTAYRLGRLFAVLERTQEEANPGLNATIRDRYFGAAASTPVTVFPRLLKLNTHHVSKLENRGRAVNLEKLIGRIIDGIDEFPALLSLQDQGRFSIGYYHQRQDLFPRKDDATGNGSAPSA